MNKRVLLTAPNNIQLIIVSGDSMIFEAAQQTKKKQFVQ